MNCNIRLCFYRLSIIISRIKYRYIYGMDIGKNVRISRKAVLDTSVHPKGTHIGNNTLVSGNAVIMTHDYVRNLKADTYIGSNCFIGANSIILPGIVIGDNVIVGAGAVVTKNVESGCVVVGNPAKVIRVGIKISDHSQLA